jgi:hypothetical protein
MAFQQMRSLSHPASHISVRLTQHYLPSTFWTFKVLTVIIQGILSTRSQFEHPRCVLMFFLRNSLPFCTVISIITLSFPTVNNMHNTTPEQTVPTPHLFIISLSSVLYSRGTAGCSQVFLVLEIPCRTGLTYIGAQRKCLSDGKYCNVTNCVLVF